MKPIAKDERRLQRKSRTLLNDILERRLLLYTVAGATIVGASPAQAQVVFTPSNAVVTTGENLNIDLKNDGVTDFVLKNFKSFKQCDPFCSSYGSGENYTLSVTGANRKLNAVTSSIGGYAAALMPGARVGPEGRFRYGARMQYERLSGYEKFGGPWLYVQLRFLGVRVQIGDTVHYGWIGFRSVNSILHSGHVSAQLLGWAYETRPNVPISTGQINGGGFDEVDAKRAYVMQEPTSLALLAHGHEAILDWRRRRAEEAQSQPLPT